MNAKSSKIVRSYAIRNVAVYGNSIMAIQFSVKLHKNNFAFHIDCRYIDNDGVDLALI